MGTICAGVPQQPMFASQNPGMQNSSLWANVCLSLEGKVSTRKEWTSFWKGSMRELGFMSSLKVCHGDFEVLSKFKLYFPRGMSTCRGTNYSQTEI